MAARMTIPFCKKCKPWKRFSDGPGRRQAGGLAPSLFVLCLPPAAPSHTPPYLSFHRGLAARLGRSGTIPYLGR